MGNQVKNLDHEEKHDFKYLDHMLTDLAVMATEVLELASTKIGELVGTPDGWADEDVPVSEIGPSVLDSALSHAGAIHKSLAEIRDRLNWL